MSGLVAVVSTTGSRHAQKRDLERLVAAYETVRGPSQSAVGQAEDRIWAARLHPVNGPAGRGPDRWPQSPGSWTLSVGVPHDASSTAGRAFTGDLSSLDGQFALVAYDETADEVLVANDPFGMLALYVADKGGLTYVSTCALALARLLSAPASKLALQSFLIAGYHFGSGCHWEGVRRLEPATAVRYGPRGTHESVYWRPERDAGVQRLSLREAADHCIDVSVSAIQRRLGAGFATWSDLTSGFDSRLLNLLADRAGVELHTNTRTSTDSAEVPTAARIAELTGWPWTHLALPAEWPETLPGLLDTALAWGDANLEVLQLSRVLWVHEQLGRTRLPLISGGGGEHLQYTSWRSEFTRAGKSSHVNYNNFLDMRMIKPSDTSVLEGNPLPAVRSDFRRRLAHWAAPYVSELNTTQLDVMHAYKMTGHYGAYRSASDGFLVTQLPYYYRDVFQAAFSTDYRHRNLHRLMRQMTDRLDSRVAALPTSRGGPAQPVRVHNLHHFFPYYKDLANKAITKTSGRLLGRPLLLQRRLYSQQHVWNAEVLDALEAQAILPVEKMHSAELYSQPALEQLLRAARAPSFTSHSTLGRIITIELALRRADVGIRT